MAGRKANFLWESAPPVANTIFAATASGTVSFQDLGTFTRAGTLRRLIVDWYLTLATLADNVECSGRVGIIIVAPQVILASTSVPRPISDGEERWLWNRGYAIRMDFITSGTSYIPLHLHDDVRGMRKFTENQHLICVLENAAGASVRTMTSVRFLETT